MQFRDLLERYSVSELAELVQAVMPEEEYPTDDTIKTENEVIIVHPVLKEIEEEMTESSEMSEEDFAKQEIPEQEKKQTEIDIEE